MTTPRMTQPIASPRDPLEVLAGWPVDRPLLLLHSGGEGGEGGWNRRWRRWSVFGVPERWFSCGPGTMSDPLEALDAALAGTGSTTARGEPAVPLTSGWIGAIAYELGHVIEPAARMPSRPRAADDTRKWPLIEMGWCPGTLLFDHAERQWYAAGDVDTSPLRSAPALLPAIRPAIKPIRAPTPGTLRLGPWRSSLDPDAYLAAVARTLEYIRAGDIFQANVTQRLSASITGNVRELALRGLEASDAWYGAYLELPGDRAIVSMSPELFLEVDGRSRVACTRPIKGTRPSGVDRRELDESAKDAAELHMIVDLMRNDLGRVCEYGSIQVPSGRTIETHGTVHHGVGEVRGTLRDGVTAGDLLRATFPGGSVTGAPKIRAMQIIDEIEPVARGPYCGAIGFISDHGDACLNVAIRTMLLSGTRTDGRFEGTVDYAVGGGIVADSEPLAEYRESLDKAAVLRLVLAGAELSASSQQPAANS